ncbi:GntR family transcriptional regulator [Paradevosia shaoguanensis]|uniref:GntR family transcriptional regulator n=1 Tax=Paradevosia shaoguanensis TaxID=1335043 RepID=A0AA41UBI6_9HYPH|nr:GntR family transcriptional regulator [Paradevosia shaoguanensis]MCF1742699.1 GntR family transcriptional regulator [Paradevosia shaoguanensis]MCI0127182.1 GntR family transcriptional regulator [Paradevosia shaoguanensis]
MTAPRKASGLDETGLEPVSKRRTVQEVVYQRLSHALMTGRFKPGQMLTISSLSTLFRTSHMPVREALRRLVAENALETASNGSAYVPAVSRERLDDLCNARVIVETAATAQAVGNMTPRIIRAIENLAEDHLDAGRDQDIQLMLAKNRDFHFMIYETANSPVLLQLIDTLWLRFGPYLRMLTNHLEPELAAGKFEVYGDHHQKLIAALKEGDAAEAVEQIKADIRETQALLVPLCVSGQEA